MSSPLNGQHFSDNRQEVVFSGRVLSAGQRVDVQLKNRHTGAWEHFASFNATTTPYVDRAGASWYEWSGRRHLPRADRYWTSTNPTTQRIQVRSVTADGTVLDTFDVGAEACARANLGGGIAQVIQNCRSASTPVVSLTASCGTRGLGCCSDGCRDGSVCDSEGECNDPPRIESNTLTAGQRLLANEAMRSPNGRYRLVMQSDCNLVLYDGPTHAIWHSDTQWDGSGCYAEMQTDGNFVVYDSARRGLFGTETDGFEGSWITLQDDNNLVVYKRVDTVDWALWSSRDGRLDDPPAIGTPPRAGCYFVRTDTDCVVAVLFCETVWQCNDSFPPEEETDGRTPCGVCIDL